MKMRTVFLFIKKSSFLKLLSNRLDTSFDTLYEDVAFTNALNGRIIIHSLFFKFREIAKKTF